MAATGKILKYTLLPGFLPRIHALLANGFGYIPFLIATIYQSTGLLPRDHAYVNAANIGRFGIRHVIAEAANRLVFDRHHIDQVLIFFIILAGIILLFLQLLLLVAAILVQKQVFALISPTDLLSIGSQYNEGPTQDLALIMLDRIFGVQGIFGSCVTASGSACLDMNGQPINSGPFPNPLHLALHSMLRFYSLGVFYVAVLVLIYFIITVAGETAASGTPFGQRFNKVWAPIRLIVAFGLLVPLNINGDNSGLNGAQVITFWAAKIGSNFATNSWGQFNEQLTGSYLGETQELVATPNAPQVNDIAKFMFIVKTCQLSEGYIFSHDSPVNAYVVREQQETSMMPGTNVLALIGTDYDTARLFSNNGPITIRFGEWNGEEFDSYKGDVKPFCGDIIVPVTQGATGPIQAAYYEIIRDMWQDSSIENYANCLRGQNTQEHPLPNCDQVTDLTFIASIIGTYQPVLETRLTDAIALQRNSDEWDVTDSLREKGWAGAAIWYNQIAALNGEIAAATNAVPTPGSYPLTMEVVAASNRMHSTSIGPDNVFDPALAEGYGLKYPREVKEAELAQILNKAYTVWQDSDAYRDTFTRGGQGPIVDMINYILGTDGLYSMRKNPDIHPLAQLTMLGRGMMEASIRNVTFGAAGSVLGGALKGVIPSIGEGVSALSSFASSIGLLTMAMAFILCYVLPFMPFIYFMFAVGGWLRAIFEAIVAMPLWALAHIRIDGDGLGGPGAAQGYFLLMEIFLRPILILFGLLASIQIFAALVDMLNEIFDPVVANISGFDHETEATGGISLADYMRGPIDEFFFTAIYTIICYMLALGCFKLIDTIPNDILRWMGASVKPLSTPSGEAGQIVERSYQISTMATQRVQGGQLAALVGGT